MGLEAYDPRLIAAWEKGATEPVVFEFTERRLATRLRHTMYRLRNELTKARHMAASSATRAVIRIEDAAADGKYKMIVEPANHEFEAAIEAAGLTIPEIDIDI